MTRSLKVWVQDSPPWLLPPEWCQAAGFPAHRSQGDVLILASTRAAGMGLLVEHGWSEREATSFMKHMHIHPYGDALQRLREARIVDMVTPGIFVWYRMQSDQVIVQAKPGGELVPVAHFRRGPKSEGGALWVEPIERLHLGATVRFRSDSGEEMTGFVTALPRETPQGTVAGINVHSVLSWVSPEQVIDVVPVTRRTT